MTNHLEFDLQECSVSELADLLARAGESRAHAPAIFRRIQRLEPSVVELPERIVRWLEPLLPSATMVATRSSVSSRDGTTDKYLLAFADGREVETVVMGYPGRFTACLSTQAGCAMGCTFCATAQMGFVRQLRAAEIVAQARFAAAKLAARGEDLRNVVLMGMGEPLANYDATMKALELLCDGRGLALSPRRITVNTVGVVPGIRRMADEQRPYNLGVSLHGSNDSARGRVVPINRRWPLAELMAACRYYAARTKRRIFFSWTLIRDVTDDPGQARELTALLDGMDAHVNLIPLNPTTGYSGQASAEESVRTFQRILSEAEIPCTVRQRRGIEVAAGCGQLSAIGRRQPVAS